MTARLLLSAVIFLAGAARAQDPVRAELAAAFGGATALAPNAELKEYVALLPATGKAAAKARLDQLDRTKLSTADLQNLSEAYVLLGFYAAGAGAGRALQERDPSGTQGLKLSAYAKLQANDFSGAAESAREALKINPKDQDAWGLLKTAEGRGAMSNSISPKQIQSPPVGQSRAAPRSQIAFTPKGKSNDPISIPPPDSAVVESPGGFSKMSSWLKSRIDESSQATVRSMDRSFGLNPGEENAALRGIRKGAIVGAGVGVAGGGLIAGAACAPAIETGAPYAACVLAGSAGGASVSIPGFAYAGGWVYVWIERGTAHYRRYFGTDPKAPEAE